MADLENKNVSDSLGSDAVHKDGTDYIKDQLAGKETTSTAPVTESASATTGAAAATTAGSTGASATQTAGASGTGVANTPATDGAEDVKDVTKQTSSDPRTTEATMTDADTPSGKNEKDTSGDDDHKPPKQAGDPKAMENKEAIPTAGGEKLGEKHWGESKIVPDNPKQQTEESGVSSAEGQPSKEVSDNTAKNTGGATSPPSGSKSPESGEKKEKFMDKMKDKFKMGKKDKA